MFKGNRQRLYHRLEQLEVLSARILRRRQAKAEQAGMAAVINKFELFLRLRGMEKGPNESLAEASARALGIDYSELRQLLRAGIDPIHRYFTENGIFEEMKERKAAGNGSPAAEGWR